MLRLLSSWLQQPTSRTRRRQTTRRRALADRLPEIEPLEGRLLLAVDVWTGADAGPPPTSPNGPFNNNWSDRYNWSNLAPPGPGDTVKFIAIPNSGYGSIDDQQFPEVFSSVNRVSHSKSPVISLVGDQSGRRHTVQEFAKSVFWNPLFFLTKGLSGNC